MKFFWSALFVYGILLQGTANASFEVKAKGTSSVVWTGGKAMVEKSNDEVIYLVDPENKKITRPAVLNAGIKEGPLSGLQSDNTVYTIVHDADTLVTRKDATKRNQRIIKAIGQAGSTDGFETVVIGEDFVTTSSSKWDYFVLYFYKRNN